MPWHQTLRQSTALVQLRLELLGGGGAVDEDQDVAQAVVRLRASTDDPRGLAQVDTALDEQRVAGLRAVVVLVVELKGVEGVVGEELVGPGKEFRPRSHLTALNEIKLQNESVVHCTIYTLLAY